MSPLHILHLLPPPSLSLLLPFHLRVLAYSLHTFTHGPTGDYLHLVCCLPGFLLVVRPAGGSFFGGSPYGPAKEEKKKKGGI